MIHYTENTRCTVLCPCKVYSILCPSCDRYVQHRPLCSLILNDNSSLFLPSILRHLCYSSAATVQLWYTVPWLHQKHFHTPYTHSYTIPEAIGKGLGRQLLQLFNSLTDTHTHKHRHTHTHTQSGTSAQLSRHVIPPVPAWFI